MRRRDWIRRKACCCSAQGCDALAQAREGFSGAEIEQGIVAALYAAHSAHAADAPLSDFTLRAELKQARPLSVLMAEQVDALRDWARGRTVPAD